MLSIAVSNKICFTTQRQSSGISEFQIAHLRGSQSYLSENLWLDFQEFSDILLELTITT